MKQINESMLIKWLDLRKNDATEMATPLGITPKRVEPNLALFNYCAINLLVKKNKKIKMEIHVHMFSSFFFPT